MGRRNRRKKGGRGRDRLGPSCISSLSQHGAQHTQAVGKCVEGMEILQKPSLTPLPPLGQASPLGNCTPGLPAVGRHCQGTCEDSGSFPVTSANTNRGAFGSQSAHYSRFLPGGRPVSILIGLPARGRRVNTRETPSLILRCTFLHPGRSEIRKGPRQPSSGCD